MRGKSVSINSPATTLATVPMNRSASVYEELYGLQVLGSEENASAVSDRIGTVVVGVFDPWNRLFTKPRTSRRFGGLPCRATTENESLEQAVFQMVKEEAGCLIDELIPALIVQDINESCESILVFAAFGRPRSLHSAYKQFRPMTAAQAQTLGINEIITTLKKLCDLPSVPPFAEIDAARALGWRYRLHDSIVRPLFNRFSSHPLREHLLTNLGDLNFTSLIDVSCGDDKLAVQLSSRFPDRLIVANDISWITVQEKKGTANPGNIIFTNHNFEALPFTRQFDVVLFKNSFHHVEPQQRHNVISVLQQLAKHLLIVVDVKTPTETSMAHKLWNYYYRFLLKDQGDTFLDLRAFTDLCRRVDCSCTVQEIDGRNGTFMIARLTGRESQPPEKGGSPLRESTSLA